MEFQVYDGSEVLLISTNFSTYVMYVYKKCRSDTKTALQIYYDPCDIYVTTHSRYTYFYEAIHNVGTTYIRGIFKKSVWTGVCNLH